MMTKLRRLLVASFLLATGVGAFTSAAAAETRRVARVIRAAPSQSANAAREIFPGASDVWMHVYGTNPIPIEKVRRTPSSWPVCVSGCQLEATPDLVTGLAAAIAPLHIGKQLLRSIKVDGGQLPLPLPIWSSSKSPTLNDEGTLAFDPSLLTPRSYRHVCAYSPTRRPGVQPGKSKPRSVAPCCVHRRPPRPTKGKPKKTAVRKRKPWGNVKTCKQPSSGGVAIKLGMRWPSSNRQGVFQYLAITDSCGNARVQPFRTQFEVPVKPMPSGQCGGGNKGVLRIFSEGGQVRVTAFNLDRPTTSTVVSETYVVPVPALQDWVSARPPRSLFNDPRIDDIIIDCAPPKAPGSLKRFLKAKRRPGSPPAPGGAKTKDGKKLRRVRRATVRTAQSTSGYPLAHQSLVIGPEPLAQGNCRLEWRGKSKNRLAVPLALRVSLQRTDKAVTKPLVEETWIVTPSTGVFRLPQLQGKAEFDGESRYRLEVHTLPNSPHGRAILVSDVATALSNGQATGSPTDVGKLVGSVTIHSAPLCGGSNLELPRNVGSCFRFYFTVPAMLATLQLTRAPWLENPIVTREVLSSVGVAFAVDRYDPVERKAFPLALQVGGFIQKIGESTALTPYVGLAPTIPFLGDGGNTTTIGLLGGLGMAYLTNTTGPDEGFKPTAFLSVVVQVGQVSPTGGSEKSSFGSMP